MAKWRLRLTWKDSACLRSVRYTPPMDHARWHVRMFRHPHRNKVRYTKPRSWGMGFWYRSRAMIPSTLTAKPTNTEPAAAAA